MCSVLNQYGNPVHPELSTYCSRLIATATGEMSTMMVWLIMHAGDYVSASHACGASSDDGSSNQPTARRRRQEDEGPCLYANGCGDVDALSSRQYIRLNNDVHASVGIHYTCDANIDFARAMVSLFHPRCHPRHVAGSLLLGGPFPDHVYRRSPRVTFNRLRTSTAPRPCALFTTRIYRR